jgi:DNA modification methylase
MTIGPGPQQGVLTRVLSDGVTHGDALDWLPKLPSASVDLFFTSPPYADARGYSRIHSDNYVEWFLPFAQAMLAATAEHGSLVLNIKNRVANRGPLKGQRHPYVYELVLAM